MSAMDSDHEKKQRRSCGSDASACSPSSPLSTDAPETNALVRKAMTEPNVCIHRLAAKLTLKCEDLERERNAARCEVVTLTVALKDIIAGNHGAMVRARKILSENDKSPSVGAKEKPMP